jgi:hypothetical protein
MTVPLPQDAAMGRLKAVDNDKFWAEEDPSCCDSCLSIGSEKKQARGPLSAKCVSLDDIISTIAVIHINDYTQEEINDTWYQKEEYRDMKKGMKQSIKFMVKYGIVDDDLEFCSRGLETGADTEQRRQSKNESFAVVNNEQQLQRIEGSDLSELIAMLYSVYTFPCQQTAYMQGVRDAQDVHFDYFDLDDMPSEFNLAYAGESVLERMASEQRISGEESFSSIEEWLVERFEKGQRVARINKLRRTYANIDIE